ncbi:phosphopantetheine binding protein [Anaerobacterium chartisolvens]|uniref:Phosphopantetheine binding protein n=1 Tax=Anaerobacterium chartisolvens TaxID=1297424 RepID=A0A369BBF1_9FIRM|nr:acyl carrier protein [Anaerobacterium chartisolvens]RCX18741.1 phosphopantetheine binding protein [Anaerobacterium chartisolvens]
MDCRNEIRKFIMENLSIDEDNVKLGDDDNYFELRFVNSLFAMKLVNFVEQSFEIEIDNDELDLKNFSTINNIMTLIDKKTVNKRN